MTQFKIFPKACTHIFNNIYFRLQGLEIGAFQQRFESELVPKNLKKLKNVLQKNFPEWFGH